MTLQCSKCSPGALSVSSCASPISLRKMVLIFRQNKRKKLFISDKLHPQTISVVETRLYSLGLKVETGDVNNAELSSRDYAGILFQYPDTEGSIKDFSKLCETAHANGVRFISRNNFQLPQVLTNVFVSRPWSVVRQIY